MTVRITRLLDNSTMRIPGLALLAQVPIGSLAGTASAQNPDIGPVGPMPYEIVEGWAKPFAEEGLALFRSLTIATKFSFSKLASKSARPIEQ